MLFVSKSDGFGSKMVQNKIFFTYGSIQSYRNIVMVWLELGSKSEVRFESGLNDS